MGTLYPSSSSMRLRMKLKKEKDVPFLQRNPKKSEQLIPQLHSGPFTSVVVSLASTIFILRFMSNSLTKFPKGFLSQEVTESFLMVGGITTEAGDFEYIPEL